MIMGVRWTGSNDHKSQRGLCDQEEMIMGVWWTGSNDHKGDCVTRKKWLWGCGEQEVMITKETVWPGRDDCGRGHGNTKTGTIADELYKPYSSSMAPPESHKICRLLLTEPAAVSARHTTGEGCFFNINSLRNNIGMPYIWVVLILLFWNLGFNNVR